MPRRCAAGLALVLWGCTADSPVQPADPGATPGKPASVEAGASPGPSVLVIVLDTLRPDYLRLYSEDGVETPGLQALAAESVVFEDVTVPGSWTWPVHASLFTGVPPWVHGAHRAPGGDLDLGTLQVQTLREDQSTLAEELQAAGYRTRSVAGNALLQRELGLMRGFEEVVVFDDRDDRVVKQASSWMAEPGEQPLFLFVNLLGSHLPYVRYEAPWMAHKDLIPLDQTWAAPCAGPHILGTEALRLNRRAPGDEAGLVLQVASGERVLEESELSLLRQTYRAEIWGTDQRLVSLLEAWDRRTDGEGIVVLTSDHGEHFGELGLLDHGHVLNGVNTRVPLVIRAPGYAPDRVTQPISQLGVADTVRSLTGLEVQTEGLLPLMRGEDTEPVTVLARSWVDPVWAEAAGGRFAQGERLVRVGDWALVAGDDGRRELFDVSEDPLMLHDLGAEHVKLLQELSEGLSKADGQDQGTGPLPPSTEMLEALESLGYLER